MWPLKTSRYLAVLFAVVLAVAEAVLNSLRPQWQYAPLWIIDYVIVVALLAGFWLTRRPGQTGVLMAAWALGAGVFYMALFVTLDPEMKLVGQVPPLLLGLIGLGLGVQLRARGPGPGPPRSLAALPFSRTGWRQSAMRPPPGFPWGTQSPAWAGAANVRKVVFVGTPFRGAAGVLDDLLLGTASGRNRALMSQEALLTFTSAFQLLPTTPDFFVDEAGRATAFPFYSPEAWWERGLGLFAEPAVKVSEGYRAQLRRQLQARQELADALADTTGPAPSFKALVVVGKNRKTVGAWTVRGNGLDLEEPVLTPGDGTVAADRALPPKPLRYTLLESDAEHASQLADRGLQGFIAQFFEK